MGFIRMSSFRAVLYRLVRIFPLFCHLQPSLALSPLAITSVYACTEADAIFGVQKHARDENISFILNGTEARNNNKTQIKYKLNDAFFFW